MISPVRLIFGVHSHQPLGNLDEVVQRALDHAYAPFLETLARHPSVKAVLHYSGCLCEWLDTHAPEHLDRIARMARAGQVELLTGAFYEPILALIPERDRVGQIRLQTRYIKERLGATARGMWLPERVWEPTLPGSLREAGVEYALLDDYHFLAAMDGDPVGGYYTTEDQGDTVRLFPISERLRYLIPFVEPEETITYLKELGASRREGDPELVAVIVDDGEKFGLWPRTHAWVHGETGETGGTRRTGWLERFFRVLEKNASWLRTTTFDEVIGGIPPRGRVYLPPGAYFEMGEWALPVGRSRAYACAVDESHKRGDWGRLKPFLRGGYFRNFQAKYPESLLMVRRAQDLSRLMRGAPDRAAADREGRPSEARRELWRAMCNCGFWHGIFGGLYLPHIRRAVGEHLCRARRLYAAESGATEIAANTVRAVRLGDMDGDGHPEVEIHTPQLGLLVEPARGGSLTVFDIKSRDFPLGLTLTRRIEAYHEDVLLSHGGGGPGDSPDHGSIHEIAASATDEMRALVVADDRMRASAVDRFFERGTRVTDLVGDKPAERGDFFNGAYAAIKLSPPAPGAPAEVRMRRRGRVAGRQLDLAKTIRAGLPGADLEILYEIDAIPGGACDGFLFAVEFNLALIESLGRIRVVEGNGEGRDLSLSVEAEASGARRLRVEEEYRGFHLIIQIDPEATVWHYPVRTVSRSEAGYEANYQGSALLFVWGEGGPVPKEASLRVEVWPRAVH